MKNIVIGICSCVLIGILILTIYTLHGRSIRKAELNQALSSGMEYAIQQTGTEQTVRLKSNQELIAVFLETFIMRIDSKSQVTVHVLDADYEKGLLSVEAILSYVHPIGLKGTVSSCQTIIRESYSTKEQVEYCCLDYTVNGSSYKTYNVQKGSCIRTPGAPNVPGKKFLGWKKSDGNEVISLAGQRAWEDCVFVAVFQ